GEHRHRCDSPPGRPCSQPAHPHTWCRAGQRGHTSRSLVGAHQPVHAARQPRSGRREEQLLEVLAVQGAALIAEARLQRGGGDREAGAIQRLGDGGELYDHVPAVAALLEHGGHPRKLPLCTLESVDDRAHTGNIELVTPYARSVHSRRSARGAPGGIVLLERIYDEDLSQTSYLIACQASGEALVVDPRRDIQQHLDLAAQHGLRITAVAETHLHADFLSGTRELAAATGATAYVPGTGGEDWQYGFEAERLHDRDTLTLGNITVTARHTPGHTPEHLSYLITDGAFADEPGYILTGDFVFSGDLGRPDLLDEAVGMQDTRFAGAKQLFTSLKEVFLALPDHVQVFPGHGSGSACGKAIGALPSTSVGYERHFAWWGPYLKNDDEQGFIDELLDGQPDAHAY